MVESSSLLMNRPGQTGPQVRILSSPLQNPGFSQGFFRISGQLLWLSCRPCTCMLAHAASSSALPWFPGESSSESSESPQNLVFPGKTGGFAAEGVGFETIISNSTHFITNAGFLPTLSRPRAVAMTSCLFPYLAQGLAPHKLMPGRGYPCREPERPTTRVLKSESLGGRPVRQPFRFSCRTDSC